MRWLGLGALCFALVASQSASATGARRVEVLTVVATTSSWWLETDAPPFGMSRGDVLFGSDALRGARSTLQRQVGGPPSRSFWRLVYRTPAVAALSETAYLGHGTITCRGSVRNGARVNRLRVVVGSGVFAGATGVCETRPSPAGGPRAALKTYRLTLP